MTTPETKLEFVPFPDAEPSPDLDVPASDVRAGDVPQSSDSESSDSESSGPVIDLRTPPPSPVDVPRVEPREVTTRPSLDSPRASVTMRPGSGDRQRNAVQKRTGLAERVRFSSIGSRLALFTLTTVMVALAIGAVATWGIIRVGEAGDRIEKFSTAHDLNQQASSALRRMSQSTDIDLVSINKELEDLTSTIESTADDPAITKLLDAASKECMDYKRAREKDLGRVAVGEAYRSALSAREDIDAALIERRTDASKAVESIRRTTFTWLIAGLVGGSLLLAALGRLVARSVTLPIRVLGRSLRRFGDGDLFARAPEAPDELGTLARSFNSMASQVSDRVRQLNADAERGSQLRMISDALDLADREPDAYRILDRAFGILTPDLPGELLLNELTSTRLWPVAANPVAGAPGCPVPDTEGCVAMRRGQPIVFDSPSAINACPHLRNHASPCSAACVPVSVNGHLLGVVHVTGQENVPPSGEIVEQLVTLAGQVGSRVGAMRTLETSRLEASTDGLTGLANRRMLEARLGDLVRGRLPFALAVADVDRFKLLNDAYGHEVGDRALQVFSKVLHDNVRGHDLVARYGGEEFVLVFPELSVAKSMEVIERIRHALAGAVVTNGLPEFSSSFGVTHSSAADSVEGIIRIADAGLLMAKNMGRNRVVFADQDVANEVFGAKRPT